jgi:putative sigma-54 modulation protein
MKITTVGRQMTVPQDLKELVAKKLEKLDKYFYEEADTTVTFSRRHNKERLEVTINVASTLFRSEAEEATFRDALDKDIDSIERQIRKFKTKLGKRVRAAQIEAAAAPAPEAVAEEDEEFVIHKKSFYFKPMSAEEAILQMNLLGHSFFVFEDSVSGDTCVVYARNDGEYGLITPTHEE